MFHYIIALAVVYLLYQWHNLYKDHLPPGPPRYPIIGSLLSLGGGKLFHLKVEEWKVKYGSLIGLKLGKATVIVLAGAKEVHEVLKREEFQGRPENTQWNSRALGKPLGLLFSDGPNWQEQRRFTVRHLRDFGFGRSSMEEMILTEIDQFFDYSFKGNPVCQVSGLFNTSIVNILWTMVAGERFSYDDKQFKRLMELLTKFFRSGNVTGGITALFPFLRKIPFILGNKENDEINIEIISFLQTVVQKHKDTRIPGQPRDFIDVYLEELDNNAKPNFDDENLISNIFDLFAAGAESTSNTLSFFILFMVLYPEEQEKIFEEIDATVGESRVSLKDRTRLPKTEAFITEVTRLRSIAPLTPPHRVTKDTVLNGYKLPQNSGLFISLYSIQHDKEYWGDPENFRPERFLDKDGKMIKDDYWLVNFGLGKRSCPGEGLAKNELFLFLTSLVNTFRFSIPDGHSKPSTECLPGFTIAPKPFEVKVERRRK